jgi:F-type H+-transporting ATPase subunit gamma
MPSLLDLRRRIRSVRNTGQITKAMKTVSTAKFKKSQRTVLEGRPHWHEGPDLLARMARWTGPAAHPLFAIRDEKRIQVIVITSDKGLCGAFNSNLLSQTAAFIEERAQRSEVRLVLLGKRAVTFFRKHPYPVDRAVFEHVDKLSPAVLQDIARGVMKLYVFQDTDGVYVAYNEFRSVLGPRITIIKLLPVAAKKPRPGVSEEVEGVLPDWEPAEPALLEALVPRYVEDQLEHAYYESQAAEQAARMMAMDSASKNAEDLINRLILVLNKIRQATITKELLEIMTTVEALKK